jgi:hypothetical protein
LVPREQHAGFADYRVWGGLLLANTVLLWRYFR